MTKNKIGTEKKKKKNLEDYTISQIVFNRQNQDSHEISDFQASVLITKCSAPTSTLKH